MTDKGRVLYSKTGGKFVASFCLCLALCSGCDSLPTRAVLGDDLETARQAVEEHNWPLAERLLERVLRNEHDSARRWEAWTALLSVVNAISPEPRTTLDYLEAMRDEFADDDQRSKLILEQMGLLAGQLRQNERAAEIWGNYVGLGWLDAEDMVRGYRNLAAAQFRLRNFEAMEETLQQCLALPIADGDKIMCMYDLAEQNLAQEHWQEAADLCQQILENLDGKDNKGLQGLAHFLRGDALEQLGQTGEALRQFELARASYPNPAVVENRIMHLRKPKKK